MTQQVRLEYRPREWQRQCHQSMRRFNVLALHRRAGKTELGLMTLIDKALKCELDLGLFVYVAPYLKQAKAIAWRRLKQKIEPLRMHGAVEVNESELWVQFKHNSAMIRIAGADNGDALRGMRFDYAVLDEIAQFDPEVWYEIIQPALADRKGGGLFIGTPRGVNLFSELYYKARDLPDWFSASYTCYDTEALDPEEVERMKRDMSDNAFEREMLCSFTAAGDDQLISLADCENAARRHVGPEDYRLAARVMGVDPARFGDDRSVIFKRQGLKAFEPKVYRGIDNMDLAARVAFEIEEWQPDAVFIDAGNGSGVIDRLRQMGHAIIEVPFAGKAINEQNLNRRVEMWVGMSEWIKVGGCIPNLTDLKQDLAAPVYWFNERGRKVLEPKDDIKKRGLPSPDLGDALALTFAAPVTPKPQGVTIYPSPSSGGSLDRNQRDYDPLARL